MLTLYHSPNSRSTSVLALLKELDAVDNVTIEIVSVLRQDGTGRRDARNPHPDGKVPLLVHDGIVVWERSAIMLYLADLFPRTGLAIPAGHPQRGAYLSWFVWYAGVVEPVMMIEAAGVAHPLLGATFRGSAEIKQRLVAALADKPFLIGDAFTAADMLLHSPYAWFGKPGEPIIDAWVDRCMARPGGAFALDFDARHKAA
jgi:glutathione S-transferase